MLSRLRASSGPGAIKITAAHVSRHDDHTGLRRKRLFALRAPLDRTHRCDRCANVARKLVARVVQSKMKVLGAAV
jgi:hypothetical protein